VRRAWKPYVGACVLGAALTAALARSWPPRQRSEPPLSVEQARAFYDVAADREVGERLAALERFRSSEWSQQDDFHAHEGNFIRDYAKTRGLPVRGVLEALDRGMREKWPAPGGVEPQERIIPCRPRLTY
jgi:hypothetical protein